MHTKGSDETNSEQINFLNNLPLKALALTKCKKTQKTPHPQKPSSLPLPMCLRVCSMVELRLTLESRPRQKRFLLLDGSVKPSTRTLRDEAWKVSPTRLLSS